MNLKSIGMRYFFGIPDAISFLNLVFGFLAILMVFEHNLSLASMCVIIAVIFDSVDGWVARKTNRIDLFGFGKNIDSLADIVSFGVAPAAILYGAVAATGWYRYFVILVCLFMIFCGLLRLARYNVISDKIDYNGFVGFPIPGIVMVLATYCLSGCLNDIVAIILMIFAGYLMISTIMYPKIKDLTVLAIGALLIILIFIPVDITISGINIPALLLLVLVLIYMLIPCLEFFLEVDDLFTKENVLKEVSKARQVTGEKFSESMDKAGSKLSNTKEKVSDMKDTVNSFSYDKESKDDDSLDKDDEWL